MLTVAVTGSVASGKSTVARIWAREGVSVVSADDLARRVVEPGTDGLRAVVDAFGEEVLAPDGSLDRAAVRDRIFRDPEARRVLESIIHPRIEALRERWAAGKRDEGATLVVAEIPLLFEVGAEDDYDVVVVVHAPEEERMRRLVEDRGLESDEARRMMESQLAPEEKRRRADRVIVNDGSPAELEARARTVLADLRDLAGREGKGAP